MILIIHLLSLLEDWLRILTIRAKIERMMRSPKLKKASQFRDLGDSKPGCKKRIKIGLKAMSLVRQVITAIVKKRFRLSKKSRNP